MSDMLERVLNGATLRMAIRARSQAGVSHRTISQLIAFYVPDALIRARGEGADRLPVELIPPDERTDFLGTLQRLPGNLANKARLLAKPNPGDRRQPLADAR